jgi:protein-S-isoprenylcysteine O-methyltransferase Ste14
MPAALDRRRNRRYKDLYSYMPRYFGALTIILWFSMVVTRIWLMKQRGIKALHFGKIDRKDFLIPPFALLYFFVVFAAALRLPAISARVFFNSSPVAWVGVSFCLAGLLLFLWSLLCLGQSFRVGMDLDGPDRLVTTGIFARSRNPIYIAFASMLTGQFLIFPNWLLLVFLVAGAWLIHRQVLREEAFLQQHYGRQYSDYCRQVRRYL